MDASVLKLVVVFAVMLILAARNIPLYVAALVASGVCWVLYAISFSTGISAIISSLTKSSTIQLLILMYVITFMQDMLRMRNGLDRSQKALTRLFHNNWITCTVAPFVIGMLPAAPAVYLSGDIIDSAAGDRLTNEEKATAASFFRHVSESFMPTYSSIITALTLTGMHAGGFVAGMLPMVIVLELIGCFFLYRGKVPMKAEGEESTSKIQDLKDFLLGIWPLIVAIILIVNFGMNVLLALVLVTIGYYFQGKFTFRGIKPLFKTAFEGRTFSNILAVYVFQAILKSSNVIETLPGFFSRFPIPTFLIFVLICFFGSVVAGSLTMTTTMIPVAFDTIPGGGYPLLCLLMCSVYAASQVSPTHICLSLSCEHFNVPLSSLIKHTIPIIVCFLIIACLYYLGWSALIS